MSNTRVIRPTDLVALARFCGRAYRNEARAPRRLGREPATGCRALLLQPWSGFVTGRRAWIDTNGRTIFGLISIRPRRLRSAWDVDYLVMRPRDADRIALNLLDYAAAGAGRSGARKLFLRLDAGSLVLDAARRAGFVPYTTERLLRLADERGNTATTGGLSATEPASDAPPRASEDGDRLPAGLLLRPREREDEWPLFQLYSRTAPAEVRTAEAATFSEWQAATQRPHIRGGVDVVVERDGRIVGWLRAGRRDHAGLIDLVVDPRASDTTDGLIGWAVRELAGSRPLFALVPEYAAPVADALVRAGFDYVEDHAVLVKRLAQTVRAGQPVRATVKPVATM